MLGRFLGGGKNSSWDLRDVENCLEVETARGRRKDEFRSPQVVVDEARPLRLAVKAGVNSAFDEFMMT